eukprot:5221557-Prymnesium_polylepis.2
MPGGHQMCCAAPIVSSRITCQGPHDIGCVLNGTPSSLWPSPAKRPSPFFIFEAKKEKTGKRWSLVWKRKRGSDMRLPQEPVQPQTVGWDTACSWVRRMNSSWTPVMQRFKDSAVHQRQQSLAEVARRLEVDLHARGVLCDQSCPCAVSTNETSVTICLPNCSAVRPPHVCEPWGDIWQQLGGPVAFVAENGCVSFDITLLAKWWAMRRSMRPFLESIDDDEVQKAMSVKAFAPADLERLRLALPGFNKATRSSTYTPLMYKRCAFVGSGHDLRCGQRSGQEIDAHEAIFRANAAQAAPAKHEVPQGPGDTGSVQRWLTRSKYDTDHPSTHSIGAALAGSRTDFR